MKMQNNNLLYGLNFKILESEISNFFLSCFFHDVILADKINIMYMIRYQSFSAFIG